ncbi:MAG: hypothetical protein QM697_00135 [Lachnospiraceae bacterium]
MSYDVMFDNKGSFSDFGMKFKSYDLTMPEAKINRIQVPGSNKIIDYSEVSGDVFFEQRKITLIFAYYGNFSRWHTALSEFSNYVNGAQRKIVLPTDKSFYYYGRAAINPEKVNRVLGTVTVEVTVDPYKKEIEDSTENYEWDTFDFENGIVRDYGNKTVPCTIAIIGRREKVIPIFTCSDAMTLIYRGTEYSLFVGENKLYDILIGEGEHSLEFEGTGTVSVSYRGGSL